MTHKDEALKAMQHVHDRLKKPEPLEGLERFQLSATVEYAVSELEQVQEVKRLRRKNGEGASS